MASFLFICLHLPSNFSIFLHLIPFACTICPYVFISIHFLTPAFNFLQLLPFAFLALHLSSTGSIYLHLPSYLSSFAFIWFLKMMPVGYLPSISFSCLHLPSSPFICPHLAPSTFICLHIPPYAFIYLHFP